MKLLSSATIAILLSLPAQASSPNQVAQTNQTGQTVTYLCSENRSFSARYGSEQVELTLDNRTLTLPQVVSGSGIRYSDGNMTLYSKGNEAFIEEGERTTYADCLSQTAAQSTTPTTPTRPAAPTRSTTTAPTPQPVRGLW